MNKMKDNEIEEFYLRYLNDLSYIPKPSKWVEFIIETPLLKTAFEYIRFTNVMASHILLSILTDLTLPLSQPFNFMFMISTFFITFLILFPTSIIVEICKRSGILDFDFYVEDKWNRMTAKEGDVIKDIVQKGHNALGSTNCSSKVFNFDLVETLLILSSIIYEQKADKVRKVFNKLKTHKGDNFDDLINLCRDEVYNTIIEKANKMEFNFVPLSELNSPDSLFAGMYFSEHKVDDNNNYIIVTFKGTSPTNFHEWLTDFLFMRADASQFVFGEIHKGFYDNFFPKTLDETKESYPAKRMIETIGNAAEKMHKNNGKDVNIWITGHSLGAALAQVFYARLIKIGTLPKYCVLRDAYVFAGPAVGDKDFASSFNGALQMNYNENKTLWRIINSNDIVPKMPPQHLYSFLRRYITKDDILNYYSIGYKVQLFLDKEKLPKGIVLRGKNEENNESVSMEDLLRKKLNDDKKDSENSEITFDNILNAILGELPCKLLDKFPCKLLGSSGKQIIESYHNYDENHSSEDCTINKIERYTPSLFHNHFPHRYFMAMERLRSDKYELMVGDQKSVDDKILADVHMVM